ncbi:hypothetical protein GF367_03565 [Candidatus Woesearchaeota archaeon]|nr:hypothetical protein [Candidatus Woesearchaeota archaeon]
MRFEVGYKGKRLQLKVDGEASSKELRSLLSGITEVEQQVSETDLRARVVRQLKTEILQDGEEEIHAPGWWDLPQDLTKNREAAAFLTMEADLNQSLVYEKLSFSLKTVITEQGKQLVLDRDQLRSSLKRFGVTERLPATRSVLVRVKGSLSDDVLAELEDYLQSFLRVDRCKVMFEKRQYGNRVSLELVLFGDFLLAD